MIVAAEIQTALLEKGTLKLDGPLRVTLRLSRGNLMAARYSTRQREPIYT